ncbi:MAG: type VII toxin-antitoxin system HepT family RNase toxin [Planctomycetota bacterium]
MTGARNDVARRKLAALGDHLHELERMLPSTLRAYERDAVRRRAVERLLQLLVESAADLFQRLLVLRGIAAPQDYRGIFRAAARAGLIPEDLVERLDPFASLRNLLVHEYDDLDDAVVHSEAGRAVAVFAHVLEVARRAMRRR